MPSRSVLIFGFIALLLPSAWLAWNYRDMPQFGEMHDDSLYYVGAKGLASGEGYKILNLPSQPYQTKYPPGYPLLLSLAWRLEPHFPENLRIAMLLNWLVFPVYVALAYLWLRRTSRPILTTAIVALNPYVVLFSTYLMSEMLFGTLILAALLLSRRVLLAALAASAAYLVRTGGVVMAASGFLCLWLENRHKDAMQFAGVMAVFVVGWTVWAKVHQSPGTGIVTLYYANYLGYQLANVSMAELPLFVWKNLDGILWGTGSLFVPRIFDSQLIKILAQTLGVAAFVGVWRMWPRPEIRPFVFFSLPYLALLAVWHFPPNERFLLPLFPLLAAGFVAEIERFLKGVRAGFGHKDRSQRVVAYVIAGVFLSIIGGSAVAQWVTLTKMMPVMIEQFRVRTVAQREAYDWIQQNLPSDANVMAAMDPLLYLYTGRHSCQLVVPTIYWYREDPKGALQHYANLVAYAREQKMGYLYLTDKDYARDMTEEDHREVMRTLKENKGLTLLKQFGNGGVYRIGEDN